MDEEQSNLFQGANKKNSEKQEGNNTPWVHPIDNPQFLEFLKRHISNDLVEDIVVSPRPQLTENPDTRELQEAEAVKNYRNRLVTEDIGTWVARTLYEESFAVNPAFTLGGVISHGGIGGSYNGVDFFPQSVIERFSTLDPKFFLLTPHDFFKILDEKVKNGEMSTPELTTTFAGIAQLGLPVNELSIPSTPYGSEMARFTDSPSFKRFFNFSWLLLGSMAQYPELQEVCTDERLIDTFKLKQGAKKINVIKSIWFDQLGKPPNEIFNDPGTYKTSFDEGLEKGVEKLAVLRSSKDFGFLYGSFSAYGAIKKRG